MLTCEAKANPAKDVRFGWSRAANASSAVALSEFTTHSLQSVLMLDASEQSFGTYFCQANNSMGPGVPCEIQVQGVGLLKAMGGANIIIIVAVIAACVVAVLIVIVAVILICRRRKPLEKCKFSAVEWRRVVYVILREPRVKLTPIHFQNRF